MAFVKSVKYEQLPGNLKAAIEMKINRAFSKNEIRTALWFSLSDDSKIYGYSESQLQKDWQHVRSYKTPIAG